MGRREPRAVGRGLWHILGRPRALDHDPPGPPLRRPVAGLDAALFAGSAAYGRCPGAFSPDRGLSGDEGDDAGWGRATWPARERCCGKIRRVSRGRSADEPRAVLGPGVAFSTRRSRRPFLRLPLEASAVRATAAPWPSAKSMRWKDAPWSCAGRARKRNAHSPAPRPVPPSRVASSPPPKVGQGQAAKDVRLVVVGGSCEIAVNARSASSLAPAQLHGASFQRIDLSEGQGAPVARPPKALERQSQESLRLRLVGKATPGPSTARGSSADRPRNPSGILPAAPLARRPGRPAPTDHRLHLQIIRGLGRKAPGHRRTPRRPANSAASRQQPADRSGGPGGSWVERASLPRMCQSPRPTARGSLRPWPHLPEAQRCWIHGQALGALLEGATNVLFHHA